MSFPRILIATALIRVLHAACIHTPWMAVLSCYGTNVTEFQMFDRDVKNSVTHMDIINTGLTQFPNLTLSDWPNLFSLDIRDNKDIDCEEIRCFQSSYPQLLILTDCDDFTPKILKDNNEKKQAWIQLLFVLLAVPFLPILTVIYKQKRKRDSQIRSRLSGIYIKGEVVTQLSLSRAVEV
jgi:hypothetical protein